MENDALGIVHFVQDMDQKILIAWHKDTHSVIHVNPE